MIALVVRVDADRSIRHDGLRTCGCDNYIFVRAVSVTVRDIVSDVIEMALGLLVHNFLVTDCGMSFRIPVYHTHSPVNQSFFIEIHESIDDGFRQIRIHGEFGTVPVTGCSEFAELAEDNAAMLFFPFPGIFEELLSGEVFLVDSLRLEPCHNLAFCRNGCVVSTWYPAGVLAVHSGFSDKHVIERIVQNVSHMKDTCHVWWRNNYSIWFSFIRFRMEKLVLEPIGIPLVLYLRRIVFCRQFHVYNFSFTVIV